MTKLEREIADVDAKIIRAEKHLMTLTAKRANLLRQTPLACEQSFQGPGCGKKSKICDLTYIQTYYYDNEPYAEGWRPDNEAQWDCPYCGHKNKSYSTVTQYTKTENGPRPWVMALKPYFGKVVDKYER